MTVVKIADSVKNGVGDRMQWTTGRLVRDHGVTTNGLVVVSTGRNR